MEIIEEKKYNLWNISNEKISVNVIRQSLSMIFFIIGQKFCQQGINYTKKYWVNISLEGDVDKIENQWIYIEFSKWK